MVLNAIFNNISVIS